MMKKIVSALFFGLLILSLFVTARSYEVAPFETAEQQYINVEITPKAQSIDSKGEAVYIVKLTDTHERRVCAPVDKEQIVENPFDMLTEVFRRCEYPVYVYELSVEGLPFEYEFPEAVKMRAGTETELELKVMTKKRNNDILEKIFGKEIFEKKIRFSVSAVLDYGNTISDKDTAFLFLKPGPLKYD